MSDRLSALNLDVVPASRVEKDGAVWALSRAGTGPRLVILAPPAAARVLDGFEGETKGAAEGAVLVGPASPKNAAALRRRLEWLRPRPLGTKTSAGLGDRLGLATPGHVRAVRAVGGFPAIAPIFPQQSIREMTRTGRTPIEVMDDATWGMFAEGWRDGTGADADHLKTTADIDACLAVGFSDVHDRPFRARGLVRRHGRPRHPAGEGRGAPLGRPRGHRGVAAEAVPGPVVRGRAPEGRLRRGGPAAGGGQVRQGRRARRAGCRGTC